ncbi:zinc-dependent metalloprotease [Neomicrococcus lactis]|uniref:Putative hydrolase n=1 Tax=Neomicrococcus lactis TaxID=732241 RepID=A0A7W8Y950_9MICC|nr:zinc-dependent metalloprotease [Neomicrococcus lactis]MBB5597221.1 putative hydrolase [Neomicrococcus lactis]
MAEIPPNNNPNDPDDNDPMQEMFKRMFGGQMPPGLDPASLGLTPGQGADPAQMQAIFRQLQGLFGAMASGESGPVNWTLAKQSAREATAGADPSLTANSKGAVENAAKLADLWLSQATSFDPTPQDPQALTSSEWVDKTMDSWKRLTEPVAISVSQAMTAALQEQIPEEMRGLMGGTSGMMQSLGGALFGSQLGAAVGALAKEVLGSTDIGLPLSGDRPALIPANIADFGEGLDLPDNEILLFVALRELAHMRLYRAVPWLKDHVIGAIEDYARGITIDTSHIDEAMRDFDPARPESMQDVFNEGLFTPHRSPAQTAALAKLENALALIEGWVDEVVADAAVNLPSAAALRETMRRRRASGGPAEQAFASIVGLELRPRRLREASQFWAHLKEERGLEGRDAAWEAEDLMPTGEDLDDPVGYSSRRALVNASDEDLDAALDRLLSGGYDESAPTDEEAPTEDAPKDDAPKADPENPEDPENPQDSPKG